MSKYYVSNSEESTRMFKSNLLEPLSKVHWTVPLILFVPTILYFFYTGFSNMTISIWSALLYMALGLLAWTITEYVMHRYVFHTELPGKIGRRLHFIFHGVHHDYPNDRMRLVLPPSVSIPLAALFYFLFKNTIPAEGFNFFFATFLVGYLCYDMIHYAIHHSSINGKIWNKIKSHHLKHHYAFPAKGFGVSSPLWDKIVGSEIPEPNAAKAKTTDSVIEKSTSKSV